MKKRLSPFQRMLNRLLFTAWVVSWQMSTLAGEPSNVRPRTSDPQLRESCQINLTRIYDALAQYRERHNTLPTWLSDLVPEFISDRDVLVCPYIKKTGRYSEWRNGLQS